MRVSLSLSLSLPGLLEGSVKNKMGLGEALSDAFSDCREGKKERERERGLCCCCCVCVCVQGGVGIRKGEGAWECSRSGGEEVDGKKGLGVMHRH